MDARRQQACPERRNPCAAATRVERLRVDAARDRRATPRRRRPGARRGTAPRARRCGPRRARRPEDPVEATQVRRRLAPVAGDHALERETEVGGAGAQQRLGLRGPVERRHARPAPGGREGDRPRTRAEVEHRAVLEVVPLRHGDRQGLPRRPEQRVVGHAVVARGEGLLVHRVEQRVRVGQDVHPQRAGARPHFDGLPDRFGRGRFRAHEPPAPAISAFVPRAPNPPGRRRTMSALRTVFLLTLLTDGPRGHRRPRRRAFRRWSGP